MNRIFFLFCTTLFAGQVVLAQGTDSKSLQETARAYVKQRDYANAIVVLNGAIQKDPKNIELRKDLAFDYYLQQENDKGLDIARSLLDWPNADVQCYQLVGMFYKAIDETKPGKKEENKECEKMYKAGIKRFPKSGVLYNEYGEMLSVKDGYRDVAIKQWEKGIEIDPNYSSNYYNAAKYYFYNDNKVWSLIYGEIFVNLESYSKRTAEIKNFLLEGYKKLFADNDPNARKNSNSMSPFAIAFMDVINKQSGAIAQGVTAESLTVLRTKFILSWYNQYQTNFPFRLFEYQHQLIKDGMFDAYNQWVFGAAEGLPGFQAWTNAHNDEYTRFTDFQKGRIFKLPEGQYYQAGSK